MLWTLVFTSKILVSAPFTCTVLDFLAFKDLPQTEMCHYRCTYHTFFYTIKKKRGLKKSNHNVESYVNTGYQVFKEEYKIVVHITQLWCWKTFQSCTFRNLITSYILTCIIPWNQWFIWVCFHTWNSCFIFKILRLRKYYGDPGQQQPNDVLVHLQK